MKCFRCKLEKPEDPPIDLVPLSKDSYKCPVCDMVFDQHHADRTEEALKLDGYIYMSNEELAEQWVDYFTPKYPSLRRVKLNISQSTLMTRAKKR